MNIFFPAFWLYTLFVGSNGPFYWGVDSKRYYAYIISFFVIICCVYYWKILRLRQLTVLLSVITLEFLFKAYILKSSGAFVFSIPLIGPPLMLLGYTSYLYPMTKTKWRDMAIILFVFYVVEVSMAIIERIIGYDIIGLQGGNILDMKQLGYYDFRSTSLWGHPLTNALVVSTVMGFILCSSIKNWIKIMLWGVGYISILCFNTRGSMIINPIILILYLIFTLFKTDRKKGFNKIRLILLIVFMAFIGYFIIANTGVGGRLTHGSLDDSSVQTRIDIFNIFETIKTDVFFYGTNDTGIDKLMYSSGLYALENFWVIILVRFGVFFLAIFSICYYFLVKKLLVNYGLTDVFIIVLTFVMVASTNDSLANGFSTMFVFLICTYIFNPKYFDRYVPRKYRE